MSSGDLHYSSRTALGFSCVLAFVFAACSGSQAPLPGQPAADAGNAAAGTAAGGLGNGGGSAGVPAGGVQTGAGGGAAGVGTAPFQVVGAKLRDRCGEDVVLRGVNEMIVWSAGRDGVPELAEIAETGANAVRLVWNAEGSAAELDVAITNAINAKLIPMIEHHAATGDLSLLPQVVDYWVSPEVVAVVRKHESQLLLNIANEAGDGNVTAATFEAAYQTAITRIREAGLTLPLVIDAPQWGQNIDVLQATWQALTAHDPRKNLLFSVHMWWHDPMGTRVVSELAQSSAAGMPLIVGEFAQHAVSGCDTQPFAYEVLLEEAQKLGIGWLAWSWGGVPNSDCKDQGSFDMTADGTFGTWKEPWGEVVAVTHAASIQKTSVRPASVTAGSCL